MALNMFFSQFGFLENLVKVFPSLGKRPLHLTRRVLRRGLTSCVLIYILLHIVTGTNRFQPYITKAYFGMTNPPVNLAKIAIGDGTPGTFTVFNQLPAVR